MTDGLVPEGLSAYPINPLYSAGQSGIIIAGQLYYLYKHYSNNQLTTFIPL